MKTWIWSSDRLYEFYKSERFVVIVVVLVMDFCNEDFFVESAFGRFVPVKTNFLQGKLVLTICYIIEHQAYYFHRKKCHWTLFVGGMKG